MKKPQNTPKAIFVILCFLTLLWIILPKHTDFSKVGDVIDNYKGVAVYHNGLNVLKHHGKHYSKNGYYFGQKWQCVEFVKRFFYQTKSHQFPNGWGHAKDYFNTNLTQGELNQARGMFQFKNGGNQKPKINDLIVFNHSKHGHVGIISSVTNNSIEIVQQNIFDKPREKYRLEKRGNNYFITSPNAPAGWLRLTN